MAIKIHPRKPADLLEREDGKSELAAGASAQNTGPLQCDAATIQRLLDSPPLMPGLDFDRKEKLQYVYIPERVPVIGSNQYDQWIVRSDGELFLVDGEFGVARHSETNQPVKQAQPIQLEGFNRRLRVTTQDVFELLAQPHLTKNAFERILEKLKKYVHLRETTQYEVVACWILATHVYRVFHKFPMLTFMSRQAGSGKTTILTLIQKLAFNVEDFNGITDSALIDTAGSAACTIVLDEFEVIARKTVEQGRTKEIINSLFDRDKRFRKRERNPKTGNYFNRDLYLFNPTVIAKLAQGGLPETVRDRSIRIFLKRLADSNRQFQQEDLNDDEDWDSIYQASIAWGLLHAADVHAASLEIAKGDLGINRRKDVWKPLLSIAHVAAPDVFDRLVPLACKPEQELDEQELPEFLDSVLEHLDELRALPGSDKKPIVVSKFIQRLGDSLRADLRESRAFKKEVLPYTDALGIVFKNDVSGGVMVMRFQN